MNKIVKEKLKQSITLFIIIVSFVTVLLIMLKYENEGEVNMPFELKEMLVVSSADASSKQDNPDNNKWNLSINQYNDVYIQIKKTSKASETSFIESVSIENINISKPNKGVMYSYMPSADEKQLFKYEDNYMIGSSLTYNGATADNQKTLEIGNQGGLVLFRIVNKDVSEYVSNDDGEIAYDGTMLDKTGVSNDDVKVTASFDIIIKTNTNKYRGKINIDLPCGDITKEGVCKLYETDLNKVIFKREN